MIDDRSRPRPCQPPDAPVIPAGAHRVAVLHRAANLDPRLRGDDGGGGVRRRVGVVSDMTAGMIDDRSRPRPCQPSDAPVTPAGAHHVAVLHRAANLDPRLRGDDGGGGVRRRVGVVSDMTAGMIDDRSRPRPCQPSDAPVTPACAHHVAVLHRATNLVPRLRGDDGGGGVRRRAGTVSDMTAGMIDDRSPPRPCQPPDAPVIPAGAHRVAVLHRAANLDPRLRGDDGRGGGERSGAVMPSMTATAGRPTAVASLPPAAGFPEKMCGRP